MNQTGEGPRVVWSTALYGPWELLKIGGPSGDALLRRICRRQSSVAVRRIETEYYAVRRFRPSGALYPVSMKATGDAPHIDYELVDGTPLSAFSASTGRGEWSVGHLLREILVALGSYHHLGMCHGRLSPWAVLVGGSETAPEVRLFDGACRTPPAPWVADAKPVVDDPVLWRYCAPEQFDVDSVADERSDVYSFGVLAYELLTGEPPFVASALSDLAYLKRAAAPRDLSDLATTVPAQTADVVMSCLETEPAHRFADAREVAAALSDRHPKRRRRSPARRPPSACATGFYGREAELQVLHDAYDSFRRGEEVGVIVTGGAGIGKTTLVEKAAGEMREARVVSTKLDPIQNRPYESIVQLLSQIDDQPIGSKLSAALAADIDLLTTLVPALKRVVGTRETSVELPPDEERTRLHGALARFFSVLGSEDRRYVVILDDVQWMDEDTAEALRFVAARGALAGIFLIICRRTVASPSAAPLESFIQSLEEEPRILPTVTVPPLGKAAAREMVRHSRLTADLADVESLYAHSGGNPFYLRELIHAMESENGPPRPEELDLPSSLVGLVAARLSEVSGAAQAYLNAASLLGGTFDGSVVTVACNSSPGEAEEVWDELVGRDLLRRTGDGRYRFSHDRIEDAVYARMPSAERRRWNRAVGIALLDAAGTESDVAVATARLNAAVVEGAVPPSDLAGLNVRSAQWALVAGVYAAAREYAENAVRFASAEEQSLFVEAHSVRARAAVYVKDYAAVEASYRLLRAHASRPVDVVPAAEAQSFVKFATNRGTESVEILLDALEGLGIRIPRRAGAVARAVQRFRIRLYATRHPTPPRLPQDGPAPSPESLAAAGMLGRLFVYCYLTASPVLAWVVLRMIRLVIRKRVATARPFAFACFGALLSATGVGTRVAIDYGSAAEAELSSESMLAARTRVLNLIFIGHYRRTVSEIQAEFRRAYEFAREMGDLESAAHSIHLWDTTQFYGGVPLDLCLEHVGESLRELDELGQRRSRDGVAMGVPAIQVMRGKLSMGDLKAGLFGDAGMLPQYRAASDRVMITGMHQLVAYSAAYSGRFAAGVESAKYLAVAMESYRGIFEFTAVVEVVALILLLGTDPERRDRSTLREVRRCAGILRSFRRVGRGIWTHRHLIVAGELAGAEGATDRAARLLLEAYETAMEDGYLHGAALAAERAAAAFTRLGRRGRAELLLREAYRLYRHWNGGAKLRQLEHEYPDLFYGRSDLRSTPESSADAQIATLLDREAVLQAVRALTEEVDPERLLEKVLLLAVRSTGATRGIIFTTSASSVEPRFLASLEHGQVKVSHVGSDSTVPQRLAVRCAELQTVVSSRELELAGPILGDPYMARRREAHFLLCPIVHRGATAGVLFVESTDSDRVASSRAAELVELLSKQAAISIANARLHARRIAGERTARSLLDAIDDGVAIVNRAGEVIAANESFHKSPIVEAAAPVGRPLLGIVVSAISESVTDGLSQAGRSEDATVEVAHLDRRFAVRFRPIRDVEDAVVRIAVIVSDVTQARADESRRQEEQHRLSVADRLTSISILTAGVAHEISNPNHVVTLQAAFLRKAIGELASVIDELTDQEDILIAGLPPGEVTEQLLSSIGDIESCAAHIDMVVKDLRTVAKGGRESGSAWVDVVDLCAATVRLAEPLVRGFTDNMRTELADDVPRVWGNRSELQQVMLNLLHNACQALRRSEEAVVVRVYEKGDDVVVEVSDEGRGMSEEDLARTTEPFFTTKRDGSGLGLAICAQIIANHGGALDISSQLGSGTTVSVRLPVRPSARSVSVPRSRPSL